MRIFANWKQRATPAPGARTRNLSRTAMAVAAMIAVTWSNPASAQGTYPSKTITFVVPSSPGTVLDILARLYGNRISKDLSTTVTVVNRPGAAGLLAAQAVVSAPADGYTFLVGNSGITNLGVMHKSLSFDPVNDFVGVGMMGEAPSVVTVPAALGVKTLQEFVSLAKSKPGSINYVSLGTGSATHVAAAYFEQQAKVRLTHVPYKDINVSASDLNGNLVQVLFSPVAPQIAQIKAGVLLGLAVSSREPMKTPVPVPTAISQGVDYLYSTWYGLMALKGIPPEAVEKISQELTKASKDPEIVAAMEGQGVVPHAIPAAEFQQYIKDEIARLAPVIKLIEATPSADR